MHILTFVFMFPKPYNVIAQNRKLAWAKSVRETSETRNLINVASRTAVSFGLVVIFEIAFAGHKISVRQIRLLQITGSILAGYIFTKQLKFLIVFRFVHDVKAI